ncbi:hypothetical protein AVEN_225716-1 [Araneus ventricosus]|uniref:Uncharacterized protein n=1 Tax=Araneus ventricosus TaxID=182803 RepID=A0A4Y2RLY2_ARAVE|nr:hypothetical protein AVEN_225716-1 [Araneus ventricosus]
MPLLFKIPKGPEGIYHFNESKIFSKRKSGKILKSIVRSLPKVMSWQARCPDIPVKFSLVILTSRFEATQRLFGTNLVILNCSQMTRTTFELAPLCKLPHLTSVVCDEFDSSPPSLCTLSPTGELMDLGCGHHTGGRAIGDDE